MLPQRVVGGLRAWLEQVRAQWVADTAAGGAAGRAGAEAAGRGARLGLAVGVSGDADLRGAGEWAGAAVRGCCCGR